MCVDDLTGGTAVDLGLGTTKYIPSTCYRYGETVDSSVFIPSDAIEGVCNQALTPLVGCQ